MSYYIDLIKRIVDQHNHYSAKAAKYKEIEKGDPFETPYWLEKKIESSVAAKAAMYNLLVANIDALRRIGYCLKQKESGATVDVQYGMMGEYRARYAYTTFVLWRCDNATNNNN